MAKLEGIHRVPRKLASGRTRVHHYAWRGGPAFWNSDDGIREGSDAYIAALNEARKDQRGKGTTLTVAGMVDKFLDSPEFTTKAERTRADYRKWALRFAAEFKNDPAAMFEEPESRGELLDWRDKWGHSPKQADYARTVAVRILGWARGRHIKLHHCDNIPSLYEVDRAEIIWAPADVEAFEARAPEWVRRILTAALETGLRPGDLIRLSRAHIEATPAGRRISIRTNKRKRMATIPVTPKMGALLDATPKGRALILVSERGKVLTEHRASEGVRQWRDKAGLSDDLRLYDCRGTAATNLLRAGCKLSHIAAVFGWSLRYAQNVIEAYAAVAPEVADEVLVLLAARSRT